MNQFQFIVKKFEVSYLHFCILLTPLHRLQRLQISRMLFILFETLRNDI
jgi:hypothetical protein